MRTIKKEVLKLIDTYVARADDLNAVKENMVPPLLDAVLVDYNRNVDLAKDAEVLNVMANIVARLGVFT
jgi:exportin-1